MELISLHPFDPAVARSYVNVLTGEEPVPSAWADWWRGIVPTALADARNGNEQAANQVTYGLAQALASSQPVFFQDGFGLTPWEARIDRGVGMLMRPPSRLFSDAGLDAAASRAMPIRLDLQHGMMGGAWIPARLIPELEQLLENRLERTARRLHDGEYDPYAMIGLMLEAVRYAREGELGLFEAMDIVGPGGEAAPGVRVIMADPKRIDPEIRQRIEIAIKPPKKPGLLSRVLGRSHKADIGRPRSGMAANGHLSNGEYPDPE
jgi:hypothetical protein